MKMYPIVVINRDSDTHRWEKMEKQFEISGLQNVTRVSAKEFSLDNLPPDFLDWSLFQIKRLLLPAKFWNWAALGCWFSHYEIWKSISEPTIIFEDDVIFNPKLDFMKEVENAVREIGKDNYDCIFFYPNKVYRGDPNCKYRRVNHVKSSLFTSFGYLLHPQFVKKLGNIIPLYPFDVQIQYLCKKLDHKFFITKKNLIYTDCSPRRDSTIKKKCANFNCALTSTFYHKTFFQTFPDYFRKINVHRATIYLGDELVLDGMFDTDSKDKLLLHCENIEQLQNFIVWARNDSHSKKC